MEDETTGRLQVLRDSGYRIYARGVGTVTPPKTDNDNASEGDE